MIGRIIVFPELGLREDWGEFEFVMIPREGDSVAATYEGDTRYLSVLQIYHLPCARAGHGGAAEVRVIAAPKHK